MLALWIILAALFFLVLYAIKLYNSLVAMRNKMFNAFAQIDVQLKRRHDLIPNLVETAKAYMTHEQSTLEALVMARSAAQQARQSVGTKPNNTDALTALAQAESDLTRNLGRFFAVVEAYPDLKAQQNLIQLSEELTTTENKVAFARQAYNDAVMSNNLTVQSFPAVLIANKFGFATANQLAPLDSENERQVPVLNL
jgi:LemA protein